MELDTQLNASDRSTRETISKNFQTIQSEDAKDDGAFTKYQKETNDRLDKLGTEKATKSTLYSLRYYEGGNPSTLIATLNSDFEQVTMSFNSFCRLIRDKLAIGNDLQLSCPQISTDYNRMSRRQLISNVQQTNGALSSLTSILDRSPFKKIEQGQIVSYNLHAYMDVGIKLTKDEANGYIKQLETALQALFDFKIKYRLNE